MITHSSPHVPKIPNKIDQKFMYICRRLSGGHCTQWVQSILSSYDTHVDIINAIVCIHVFTALSSHFIVVCVKHSSTRLIKSFVYLRKQLSGGTLINHTLAPLH